MLVRHDAKVEMTLKSGRRILEKTIVDVKLVDTQMEVWSITHGGISGNVYWNHLGRPIAHPKVAIRLVDKSDILADGQLCPCAECMNVS
jgi:hypothetical protein